MRSVPLQDVNFAVIDLETTGLSPRGHDRVIEVAVVKTMMDQGLTSEYDTLVNPKRDIGPTAIHGVESADVLSAPCFEDIAGDLTDLLSESVLVGHNVDFDLTFLAAEFNRLGVDLGSPPSVCTLTLSAQLLHGAASCRLTSCCQMLGIPIIHAHSALADARATAALLMQLVLRAGYQTLSELECRGTPLPAGGFPQLMRSGLVHPREQARSIREEEETYLARLISRLSLPALAAGSNVPLRGILAYLDLLDRSLEDRYMAQTEADQLIGLATEWGLSSDTVWQAHREYLRALIAAALADGIISQSERADLIAVTQWLGLAPSDLDRALDEARTSARGISGIWTQRKEDLAGKCVCFTGELRSTIGGRPITREMAQEWAVEAGLRLAPGVSKKLDLLVCADPLSQSGKAKKAREHGIRVVAETTFWQMIGVAVD